MTTLSSIERSIQMMETAVSATLEPGLALLIRMSLGDVRANQQWELCRRVNPDARFFRLWDATLTQAAINEARINAAQLAGRTTQ